jgi:ribosome-binding protein aMBF1 (putative translation factor)
MAKAELKPKFIEVRRGKRLVILEEAEYERLLDAVDAAEARRILDDETDPVLDWSEACRELITNRIAEVRRTRDISQRDLAAKLEVQPSTLSRWEKKDANLTLETLRKIAKALGCSVVSLIA